MFILPNNFKTVYISSWDDNNIKSFEYLNNYINKINSKVLLTLFVPSNHILPDHIDRFKNILKNGHTIESHSINHDFKKLEDKDEYIESKNKLIELFGKDYSSCYCYPFGTIPTTSDTHITIQSKYTCARSVKYGKISNKNYLSDNLYELPCIPIEDKNINNIILDSINNNNIIITYGHGIKDIGGWNPVELNHLQNHFSFLKKYEKDIWFTTLPKLIKYLQKTNQINIKYKISYPLTQELSSYSLKGAIKKFLKDSKSDDIIIENNYFKTKIKTKLRNNKLYIYKSFNTIKNN